MRKTHENELLGAKECRHAWNERMKKDIYVHDLPACGQMALVAKTRLPNRNSATSSSLTRTLVPEPGEPSGRHGLLPNFASWAKSGKSTMPEKRRKKDTQASQGNAGCYKREDWVVNKKELADKMKSTKIINKELMQEIRILWQVLSKQNVREAGNQSKLAMMRQVRKHGSIQS